MTPNKIFFTGLLFILLTATECPKDFVEIDEDCYYKRHMDILQNLIDVNESLRGLEPQNIGTQKWNEGKLTSLYLGSHLLTQIPDSIGLLSHLNYLDLRKNQLITIPDGICRLQSYKTEINLADNHICPPYPDCFDYINQQNTRSCEAFKCPDGYMEIEDECFKADHIKVLQAIIDNNASLHFFNPLELDQEIGYQQWENGKLIIMNIMSNRNISLPEDVCSILPELQSFNIENNALNLPYPSCLEYLGYQQISNYTQFGSCPEGYVTLNEMCYFHKDIQVLTDLIKLNLTLKDSMPLMVGRQKWINSRLQLLDLSNLAISAVPESIQDLEHLEYLNLSNNKLQILPEALCKIYQNLLEVDLANNQLCPPYADCFDYIGQQDTANCTQDYCLFGYMEIDGACYYKKDLAVLHSFISKNVSLSGKGPLEIGVQKWKNMRLDVLYLGVNELTLIPESICEIYTNLSAINIAQNNICPPYPVCIAEIVLDQDTSNCP